MKTMQSHKIRDWLRKHPANPKKLRAWLETEAAAGDHALTHVVHDKKHASLRTKIVREFKIK